MKWTLMILTLLSGFSASAMNCTDYFGRKAYLSGDTKVVRLQFDTYQVPASGNLKYSGERSRSAYYYGNGFMAEIEKTVFSSGTGHIWYHFPNQTSDHATDELVTFTCR